MFAIAGPVHAADETTSRPEERPVERPFSVGVLAGYGQTQFVDGGFGHDANPYGIGFGLEISYELESHWILGIGGQYFLGGKDRVAVDSTGALVSPSPTVHYALGYALVGHEFRFLNERLVVRPSLAIGATIGQTKVDARYSSGVAAFASVGPGVGLHYLVSASEWYVGEDFTLSLPIHTGHTQEQRPGLLVSLATGKRF